MQTIDSTELNLSTRLRQSLGNGDTVVVSEGTHQIAFIIGASNPTTLRPLGLCKGEFTVPDDFNEPSPEIEALFYGEPQDNSPPE